MFLLTAAGLRFLTNKQQLFHARQFLRFDYTVSIRIAKAGIMHMGIETEGPGPRLDPPGQNDYRATRTVLNSLDALVYVSDMQTYEMLFMNEYGRAEWGPFEGKKCYKVLQSGQDKPCAFCTNNKLLDAEGRPTGVYVWEFQNTQNGHWYQCRDQAIPWIDGRLVRIEIATDITDRKQMEQNLAEAKALAEMRASTDELTGLKNRRAFFEMGRLVCRQAIRAHRNLSVIMFDLDYFKRINDRWGHAAGDMVLTSVSRVAENAVRASDILARLGGEEFAVLLPDTDGVQAAKLAERIRTDIQHHGILYQDKPITCTASFGVAEADMEDLASEFERNALLDELLNQADHAMMFAKQSGRNRLQMADQMAS